MWSVNKMWNNHKKYLTKGEWQHIIVVQQQKQRLHQRKDEVDYGRTEFETDN